MAGALEIEVLGLGDVNVVAAQVQEAGTFHKTLCASRITCGGKVAEEEHVGADPPVGQVALHPANVRDQDPSRACDQPRRTPASPGVLSDIERRRPVVRADAPGCRSPSGLLLPQGVQLIPIADAAIHGDTAHAGISA